MLWNAFILSAPFLGAVLIVGLVIGVLQVVTQLQEMTLSFVPKLIVAGLVLGVAGPWMMGRIVTYAEALYKSIPAIAN
jgi:flagellar biosynthesis protein FliQ